MNCFCILKGGVLYYLYHPFSDDVQRNQPSEILKITFSYLPPESKLESGTLFDLKNLTFYFNFYGKTTMFAQKYLSPRSPKLTGPFFQKWHTINSAMFVVLNLLV